jgi:hypothetical protein
MRIRPDHRGHAIALHAQSTFLGHVPLNDCYSVLHLHRVYSFEVSLPLITLGPYTNYLVCHIHLIISCFRHYIVTYNVLRSSSLKLYNVHQVW